MKYIIRLGLPSSMKEMYEVLGECKEGPNKA